MNLISLTAEETKNATSPANRFKLNSLISARGWALVAFLTYLLLSPVLKEYDIIATVFVYVLGAYILVLLITTLTFSMRIKNSIRPQTFQPESLQPVNSDYPKEAHAGIPALFVIKLNKIYIPPGYYLEMQAFVENGDMNFSKHILTGKVDDEAVLVEQVTFPHRGHWKISHIQFFLADKFNLTYFKWAEEENIGAKVITVHPSVTHEINLPVISSASRSGDTLPDMKERLGDLFDLKPYHPSDGIKKILWKVYAKSGELISRHPEASMTPEGQVLVFTLAGKNDEHVCAVSLAYLKILQDLNLQILFTCLGLSSASPATGKDEAEKLLIKSVWNAENSQIEDCIGDLQSLISTFNAVSSDAKINKIVLFCSREYLCSQKGYALISKTLEFLESLSIEPYICVCKIPDYLLEETQAPTSWLQKAFFSTSFEQSEFDIEYYYKFLATIRAKSWELTEQEVL